MMQEVICSVFMVIGAVFMCVAGLGILRMPDLFMRMSSGTKASTLGVGFLLAAVAVRFPVLEVVSRTVAIIVFILLTAPVAAHMIGRAAYVIGIPLWKDSMVDELCEHYKRCAFTFEDEALEVSEASDSKES
jgi:multicomponent Na+:H+ antiporter subunit G